MCTPTLGVWQPSWLCVSCELVCVYVSLERVVVICLASTHTALVSSPMFFTSYIHTYISVATRHSKLAPTRHRYPKHRNATKQGIAKNLSLETSAAGELQKATLSLVFLPDPRRGADGPQAVKVHVGVVRLVL